MKKNRQALIEERIYPLLVAQVYDKAGIGIFATVVNASILAFILWDQISHAALVIWLTVTLLSTAVRFLITRKYQRSATAIPDAARWGRRMVAGLVISGLLWGSCAIFLFPAASIAHQAFIAFVIAGMVAGAVGVFSAIPAAFLAFSIPALLPIIIRFALLGDPLHLAMAFMSVFFGLLMMTTASRINSSIRELVVLRETFADQLEQRTAELITLNEQLKLEIAEREKTEASLKTTEAQIEKSLREKTTLLQEIHHRVKNNMQVIISLMHLQAAQMKDDGLKTSFKEASSRVNAMALIHNILYQSSSISEVNLRDYFSRLAESLIRMYAADRVRISIGADRCHLSMDQAIPTGLILNELISNALQHAFPDRNGQIRIQARYVDNRRFVMKMQDDGVGLPDHIDLHHAKTLGLKLVSGLAVQQLGGRIEVDRSSPGTAYRLEFETPAE